MGVTQPTFRLKRNHLSPCCRSLLVWCSIHQDSLSLSRIVNRFRTDVGLWDCMLSSPSVSLSIHLFSPVFFLKCQPFFDSLLLFLHCFVTCANFNSLSHGGAVRLAGMFLQFWCLWKERNHILEWVWRSASVVADTSVSSPR